jgi:hypothetical protein
VLHPRGQVAADLLSRRMPKAKGCFQARAALFGLITTFAPAD